MGRPKGPPLWAVDAAKTVSRGMSKIQRKMAPPSAAIVEMVTGVWRPYAIWVVAELGIADEMATGPRDVGDLARATGTDETALLRVLAPLAHDGLLTREGRRFGLTSLTEPLRSDHPKSVRNTVRQCLAAWNKTTWAAMLDALRTGAPAFPPLHGDRDLWTYFAEEAPEDGKVFHDSMAELTRMIVPLLVAEYEFERHLRVLDLGGGRGRSSRGSRRPSRGCVVVSSTAPTRWRGAPEVLAEAGVRDRVELVEGNLFDGVPEGWDAYVLKNILHGLNEDALGTVLGHVRGALTPGSRLLVVEALVPEPGAGGVYPAYLDLQMLVGAGGRERSARQYESLFAEHGMRLEGVTRTASPMSLLEVALA